MGVTLAQWRCLLLQGRATLMSFTSYHLPSFSPRPGSEEAGSSAAAHLPPEAGSYLELQIDLKNSWYLSDHSGWRFFCFTLFLRDHSISWVNLAFSDPHSQINVLLGEHRRVTSAAFQPHQDKGVSSDDALAKGPSEDPSRTTIFRWWGIMCFLSQQKPNMWPVTWSSQGAREANKFLKRLRKDNLLRHKKEINSNSGGLEVKLHLEDDFDPSWIERFTK